MTLYLFPFAASLLFAMAVDASQENSLQNIIGELPGGPAEMVFSQLSKDDLRSINMVSITFLQSYLHIF